MKIKFGEWLKKELARAGISQTDLANRIGLQPPQVSRIISGTRGTDLDVLEAIANVLKIPPEVVFRAAAGKNEKQTEVEFADRIEALLNSFKGKETKEEALRYLEYLAMKEEKAEYRVAPSSKPSKNTKSP